MARSKRDNLLADRLNKNKAFGNGITGATAEEFISVPVNSTKEPKQEAKFESEQPKFEILKTVVDKQQVPTNGNEIPISNALQPLEMEVKHLSEEHVQQQKKKFFDFNADAAAKEIIENPVTAKLGFSSYKAIKQLNSHATAHLLKGVSDSVFIRNGVEVLLQLPIDWEKVFTTADNKNNKFEKVLREEIKAVLKNLQEVKEND